MKSNTLQGSRKNAQRCTMMRAVTSTTKIPDDEVVEQLQDRPIALTSPSCEVCNPSVMALMMISVMITRSVRGSSTMVRSLASTFGIPPVAVCRMYSSAAGRSRGGGIVEAVQAVDGGYGGACAMSAGGAHDLMFPNGGSATALGRSKTVGGLLLGLGLRRLGLVALREARRLELRDPVDGRLLIAPVSGGRDMRRVGLRRLVRRLFGQRRSRPGWLAGLGFARGHAAVIAANSPGGENTCAKPAGQMSSADPEPNTPATSDKRAARISRRLRA